MYISNLRKNINNSIKWSLINQVLILPLGLAINVILVRLISPSDYGLIGMITPAIGIFLMISSFGISSSLVSKKNIDIDELSSLFIFRFTINLVIGFVIFLLASPIAMFYDQPELKVAIPFYSIVFVLTNLYYPLFGLLQRERNFKSITTQQLIATFISGAIGILLAVKGFAYKSLIAKEIIFQFLLVCLAWYNLKLKLNLSFNTKHLVYHFNFGSYLTLNGFLQFFSRNLDDIIIGRQFGSASLGIYNKSYSLLVMPLNSISKVLTKAMLPEFAIHQDDNSILKKLYFDSSKTVLLISAPLAVFLFIAAENLVLLIFGQSWSGVIPFLKLFSLIGVLQSLGPLTNLIYEGTNNTDKLLRQGFAVSSITISSIILGYLITDSAYGIALFYACGNLLTFPISQYFALKPINQSLGEYLHQLIPYLITAALTLGISWLLFSTTGDSPFHIIEIIKKGAFIGIVYIGSFYFFFNKEFVWIKNKLITFANSFKIDA